MVTPLNKTDSVLDLKNLDGLKKSARENSPAALTETARQFEAMFVNMMLKSMRDATPQDSMFNNEQTKMYTSMLDQQLSQTLASKGLGLADVLTRQLSSLSVSGTSAAGVAPVTHPTTIKPDDSPASMQPAHVKNFYDKVGQHATAASQATGIPANFMVGQAALESGWGKHEIIGDDGVASHNLFNIKATASWKGKTVTATTTEYVDGVPHKVKAQFRAYDSYAAAFNDYASLLKNNPRYKEVLASAQDASAFAHGLQRAGYATDPQYAKKLLQAIAKTSTT